MSRSDDTKPPFESAREARSIEDADLDAPPSEEELAAAAKLRHALESEADSPERALADALRAAHAPSELDPLRQEQILNAALRSRSARSNVRYVVFGGVASLAALAASVALMVTREPASSSAVAFEPVAPIAEARPRAVSRSAAALFPEGIPASGGTSERVDRIAYARAQDLRENRFARWGVR